MLFNFKYFWEVYPTSSTWFNHTEHQPSLSTQTTWCYYLAILNFSSLLGSVSFLLYRTYTDLCMYFSYLFLRWYFPNTNLHTVKPRCFFYQIFTVFLQQKKIENFLIFSQFQFTTSGNNPRNYLLSFFSCLLVSFDCVSASLSQMLPMVHPHS